MSRGPGLGGPSSGPSRPKPRGPPPTSPYGMMNTPPSGYGGAMNTPNSQRGPPGGGNLNMNNGRRGSVPKGPPPRNRGPPPQGPPPRNYQGGTPTSSSRIELPGRGQLRTPNSHTRMQPGRSPHIQGKTSYICIFSI